MNINQKINAKGNALVLYTTYRTFANLILNRYRQSYQDAFLPKKLVLKSEHLTNYH